VNFTIIQVKAYPKEASHCPFTINVQNSKSQDPGELFRFSLLVQHRRMEMADADILRSFWLVMCRPDFRLSLVHVRRVV